jgi:hypothetical protein
VTADRKKTSFDAIPVGANVIDSVRKAEHNPSFQVGEKVFSKTEGSNDQFYSGTVKRAYNPSGNIFNRRGRIEYESLDDKVNVDVLSFGVENSSGSQASMLFSGTGQTQSAIHNYISDNMKFNYAKTPPMVGLMLNLGYSHSQQFTASLGFMLKF